MTPAARQPAEVCAAYLAAFATGLGITLLLQSSTATVLMAGSFASRGLVDTAAALAIMLGADVGTTLVAQLFSSPLAFLSPLLGLYGAYLIASGTGVSLGSGLPAFHRG